ncbi:MAG: hypothetical protein KF765_09305 [Parvibaculaceae bacterium]|nr:hypothetical protein [Parvibaculaceae bacterium]
MREKRIEAIRSAGADLTETIKSLMTVFAGLSDEEGRSFELNHKIAGKDSTVSAVLARIGAALGLISEFGEATRGDLVPRRILVDLEGSLSELKSNTENLRSVLKTAAEQNGGVKKFSYGDFHLHAKNGNAVDVRPPFHAFFDSSEKFLETLFPALLILKPRSSYSFQAAASGLDKLLSSASETLSESRKTLKNVGEHERKLAEKDSEIRGILDELSRLKSDGAADRKTISDYLAEVTQQKAAVQAVHDEARSLKETVENYKATFDQFQKQLNDREKTFSQGTEKLTSLVAKFNDQQKSVANLISKSEEMLSSATVSGLATNFSTMTEKLTKELGQARLAFYVGIVFLTVSAIPLLAFVLLPILAPFFGEISTDVVAAAKQHGTDGATNPWQYLGQVIARIAILLPAAWFVSFAAIRHSSLFKLREHYAYKYSMAVSVQGFKLQAPNYDQEIAALVLEQLAFNPADTLASSKDAKETRAPGIGGYLLEKIRERIDKRLAADGE